MLRNVAKLYKHHIRTVMTVTLENYSGKSFNELTSTENFLFIPQQKDCRFFCRLRFMSLAQLSSSENHLLCL